MEPAIEIVKQQPTQSTKPKQSTQTDYYSRNNTERERPAKKGVFWMEYEYSKAAPIGITLGGCKTVGGYGRLKLSPALWKIDDAADVDLSLLNYNDKIYRRAALTGGLMVRLFNGCYLYGGGGIGAYDAGYKANDDTGSYYFPDGLYQEGIEAEGGMVVKLSVFSLSVGYSTLFPVPFDDAIPRFSDVNVGIGFMF